MIILDLMRCKNRPKTIRTMNTKILKTYLNQYDSETDPENKLILINVMIDILKKDALNLQIKIK